MNKAWRPSDAGPVLRHGRAATASLRFVDCRGRGAFTLVEMLLVIGITAALAGVVVPVVGTVRESAMRAACASNLRQIGSALNVYRMTNEGSLPVRPSGLDQTNPHVMKFLTLPESVARQMQSAAGSRDVYYCPGNYQQRTARDWWPYVSGTIAATYQFPFWLKDSRWLIPKPQYKKMSPDVVLAADYLGSDIAVTKPRAWNHRLSSDGSPLGMNLLMGDGHVEWRDRRGGWVLYGRSTGPIDWYYAQ
jgi:prepilin-type processing-associated H-X9-DG protein